MKINSFNEVSSFEAKTNFSQLLQKFSKGEKITILKHNNPVAVISPFNKNIKNNNNEVVESLKLFSKGKMLQDISIEYLIKEGRK
jgi:prevent-host-death family protein